MTLPSTRGNLQKHDPDWLLVTKNWGFSSFHIKMLIVTSKSRKCDPDVPLATNMVLFHFHIKMLIRSGHVQHL